jgi:hypothetical protein
MGRVFEVAEEYATYNRTRTTCERAVDGCPLARARSFAITTSAP